MKHLSLVAAALLSSGGGAYLLHRHSNHFDDYFGGGLIVFALYLMAKVELKELAADAIGWWQSFKGTKP